MGARCECVFCVWFVYLVGIWFICLWCGVDLGKIGVFFCWAAELWWAFKFQHTCASQ